MQMKLSFTADKMDTAVKIFHNDIKMNFHGIDGDVSAADTEAMVMTKDYDYECYYAMETLVQGDEKIQPSLVNLTHISFLFEVENNIQSLEVRDLHLIIDDELENKMNVSLEVPAEMISVEIKRREKTIKKNIKIREIFVMDTKTLNAKEIRVYDESEYQEGLSNNGGCYGYVTYYKKQGDKFQVSYGTTADMEYCPNCGSFGNHLLDDDYSYSCGEPRMVTPEELIAELNEFEKNDDYIIKFKWE